MSEDRDYPAAVYSYTPTRERAGPERFIRGYRGYLQADSYVAAYIGQLYAVEKRTKRFGHRR